MKYTISIIDEPENCVEWEIKVVTKKVGRFIFRKDKLGRMWLDYCEIKDDFQEQGIGSAIIIDAVKKYGAVYFSNDYPDVLDKYYGRYMRCYLTPEGQKFVASLKRKGIIKDEWHCSMLGVLEF